MEPQSSQNLFPPNAQVKLVPVEPDNVESIKQKIHIFTLENTF